VDLPGFTPFVLAFNLNDRLIRSASVAPPKAALEEAHMTSRSTPQQGRSKGRRRWHDRAGIGIAVVALAAGGSIVAASASTSRSTPQLQSIAVSPYSGLLANSKGFSLYVLSAESAGKFHCTGGCLRIWPPFLVKTSVKTITRSRSVIGSIGFDKRSSTTKQVTFNGFPVYKFTGDTSPRQVSGEGIVADGGTWTLVSAGAKTNGTTPVKPRASLITTSAVPYKGVLARGNGLSLYVLSAESKGTLHCTGGCTSIWPPLLVPSSVTSIPVGAGVMGTIGFVARSATTQQVTFNGFPVYLYSGDSGSGGSSGEGIAADGGTWYLASASATTQGATEIPPVPPGSTTTTTYRGGY